MLFDEAETAFFVGVVVEVAARDGVAVDFGGTGGRHRARKVWW